MPKSQKHFLRFSFFYISRVFHASYLNRLRILITGFSHRPTKPRSKAIYFSEVRIFDW